MGKTKIEWATKVWNPVVGCTKISEGCKNCYAERIFPRAYHGHDFNQVRVMEGRLEDPLHWRAPQRIFVNSMSDLFHPLVPMGFILEIMQIIRQCPQHTFMVLTKRPQIMQSAMEIVAKRGGIPQNLWLGVSVENQRTADERIFDLLQTPAAKRFVSCEPLLGPVDLGRYICETWIKKGLTIGRYLDWVIVGGETGPAARPMDPLWALDLMKQCRDTSVPFFFKSWGEWTTEFPQGLDMTYRKMSYKDGKIFYRVGKKLAGRDLDGKEWNEFPEVK
jgi:protein gp37